MLYGRLLLHSIGFRGYKIVCVRIEYRSTRNSGERKVYRILGNSVVSTSSRLAGSSMYCAAYAITASKINCSDLYIHCYALNTRGGLEHYPIARSSLPSMAAHVSERNVKRRVSSSSHIWAKLEAKNRPHIFSSSLFISV